MGRRKAVYQRSVPNPPQDHSEGQVPHKVTTRDGQGVAAGVLALDSLLRSADSRCFWGRRSTAPLPGESAGPSTTGNRKSAALSKWGRLKHTGKIALVEENSTHSISQARACHFFFFSEPVNLEDRQFHSKRAPGRAVPSWLQQQQATRCPANTEVPAPPARKLLYVRKAVLMQGCAAD